MQNMTIVGPEYIFKFGIQGKINADFYWREFIKEGTPTLQQLKNIKKTADRLSFYKKNKFKGRKTTITCGWRTWARHVAIYSEINAERAKHGLAPLEVPKNSLHLSGLAVDFVVEGFTIPELYVLMDEVHFGGVEKTGGNWQHIDERGSNIRFTPSGAVLKCNYNLAKHNELFHPGGK